MGFTAKKPPPHKNLGAASCITRRLSLHSPRVRDAPSEDGGRASGAVPLEKKSKRQFRRDRKQVTTVVHSRCSRQCPTDSVVRSVVKQLVPGACGNACA